MKRIVVLIDGTWNKWANKRQASSLFAASLVTLSGISPALTQPWLLVLALKRLATLGTAEFEQRIRDRVADLIPPGVSDWETDPVTGVRSRVITKPVAPPPSSSAGGCVLAPESHHTGATQRLTGEVQKRRRETMASINNAGWTTVDVPAHAGSPIRVTAFRNLFHFDLFAPLGPSAMQRLRTWLH